MTPRQPRDRSGAGRPLAVRAALGTLLPLLALLALLVPGLPPIADAAPAGSSLAYGERGRGIGYGAVLANRGTASQDRIANDLGFGWVKYQILWPDLQPTPGGPLQNLTSLDTAVDNARARGLQVLIHVLDTPAWAASTPCGDHIAIPPRPDQYPAYTAFLRDLAAHFQGRVTAYEIWNEPNTSLEWGGCRPDAIAFARVMAAATAGVRAGDPQAIVVSGGLSNTGNGSNPGVPCTGTQPNPGACGDLIYLQTIYASGEFQPGRLWDAIGHHPYGGTCAPAAPNGEACEGLYFRRMESVRNIINDFGVPAGESPLVPLWATEMGWLSDQGITGCNIGSKDSQKVTPAQQAQYMAQAYQYARDNWPWTGPLFAFLPDYNVGFAPGDCDSHPGGRNREFRWYSAFTETGLPNAQGQALAALPKAAPDLLVQWQDPPTRLPASLGSTGTGTTATVLLRNGVGGSSVLQQVNLAPGQAQSSPASLLSWRWLALRSPIPVQPPPIGSATSPASLERSLRDGPAVLASRTDAVVLEWDCPWEWLVAGGFLADTVLAPYRAVRTQQGTLPGGARLVALFDAHRGFLTRILIENQDGIRGDAVAVILAFLPYVLNLTTGDGQMTVDSGALLLADEFLAKAATQDTGGAFSQAFTAEQQLQGGLLHQLYAGLPVSTVAAQVRAASAGAGMTSLAGVTKGSLAGGW